MVVSHPTNQFPGRSTYKGRLCENWQFLNAGFLTLIPQPQPFLDFVKDTISPLIWHVTAQSPSAYLFLRCPFLQVKLLPGSPENLSIHLSIPYRAAVLLLLNPKWQKVTTSSISNCTSGVS